MAQEEEKQVTLESLFLHFLIKSVVEKKTLQALQLVLDPQIQPHTGGSHYSPTEIIVWTSV